MAQYKDLSDAKVIVVDIETYDPNLLELGAGVYRADGYILGVSIADDKGFAEYYNLGHYDCREAEREKAVEYLRTVLALPCPKLGANIPYDIDWLTQWKGDEEKFGFRGRSPRFEVNGLLYDIQVAEPLIDENQGRYSLDFQAKKYLGVGKLQDKTKQFCTENGLQGDPRKWLWKMPYNIVREYAMGDVTQPLEIFRMQWETMKERELLEVFLLETKNIRAIMHMRANGVHIDTKRRDVNAYIATTELEVKNREFTEAYGEINLNSTKQLADFFERENIEYNYKITYIDYQKNKKQEQLTYADGKAVLAYIGGDRSDDIVDIANRVTGNCPDDIRLCNPSIDKECLESLEREFDDLDIDGDNIIKDILYMRKADKMIKGFLMGPMVDNLCHDGKIHPDILSVRSDFGGTRTGRYSMRNPNLQQVPSPSRNRYWGTMCRECFVPEPNCWWAKIDYSQIEYRILAHYASGEGSEELRDKFSNDPHTDYHQYIVDLTGLSRSFAKNLNFGVMYGMGKKKMSRYFKWEMAYAIEVISQYHDNAPYIRYTMDRVSSVAKARGYIRTLSGRRSHLVDKNKAYKMLNSLIQGSAADFMKKAIFDVYESGVYDTLTEHLTVHDELDVSVPKTAKGLREIMRMQDIMEKAYPIRVPVKAELEMGKDWGHLSLVDFTDIAIDRQEWLDGLTDENCVSELQRVIDACKVVEAEKEARKKK